jgi:tetratricopeptide (TPR) repeat protein
MARDAQDELRITNQFNFEVFWAEHGKRITTAVVVVGILGFVLLYWQHQSSLQGEQAADSLAHATDVASLEQVTRDFPKSPVAAEAMSRLADVYYRNGKYAEAASTYERITRDFPTHPLAESAKVALAGILEAQGNLDGASTQYFQIVNSNPNAYVANSARMGLARCLEGLGRKKEARQVYEEILASGQNSPWFAQAYLQWVVLSRDVLPEKVEESSAGPTTTPAQGGVQLPSLLPSP